MSPKAKLWTGKTPRQELLQATFLHAVLTHGKASHAVEHILDGGNTSPEGSIKHAYYLWWTTAEASSQESFLGRLKADLRRDDRLMGRTLER